MSKIILHMEPSTDPMTREGFAAYAPPNSFALDGFVTEGPYFDPELRHHNFNHHERVFRLGTYSTCGQILITIRQGLFKFFTGDIHVYINDCDQDVCASVTLLRNPSIAKQIVNPLLNRLIHMENLLDLTAGTMAFPVEMPAMEELAWIFDPYARFRVSGQIDLRNPKDFEGVIADVEQRILAYIAGHGNRQELDTRYDQVASHGRWTMVREIGAQARSAMFADGITAFIAVRDRQSGGYSYSIGRQSPYIPFPVPELLKTLSTAEPDPGNHQWGGGDTIGGSNRANGSQLDPDQVSDVVEKFLVAA